MHPYLRAYIAGIALPTMILPFVIVGLVVLQPTVHGFHIEEVLIFPIALVPNAWGLCNMLYVWTRRHREIPIGLFGMALVVVIAPLAYALQLWLGKVIWAPGLFAVGFPVTLALYYLAWKFIVARFNEVLGVG